MAGEDTPASRRPKPRMVPVEESVGSVLFHDITRIVPGSFKGRAFRRGHVIRREDIPELLKLGKEHVYVWEASPGEVHEEEAAVRIARAVAGEGVNCSEPVEGRVNLTAAWQGLLRVRSALIHEINSMEHVVLATLHDAFPVQAGQRIAGTRVIPLVVEEEAVARVERAVAVGGKPLEVRPYRRLRVGIVITGSEVYKGRIPDSFGPVLRDKLAPFQSQVVREKKVPDDPDVICRAILETRDAGAEVVLVTGGMSVDPDDRTPGAIKRTGACIVAYGAPVLPGSMFLLAYLGEVPILGLPGCVMYEKTTVFDLILPRLLVGERVGKNDITRLGLGGLCLSCPECTYPLCHFGKSC